MTNLPSGGQRLRDYEILGRIGAGGMGVIFKARDVKLDRTVALKFLPATLYANHSDRNSLLHEARAISALDHPNICTIFGLEETDDGGLFMAMAYYDGGTLADRIAQGPVPLAQALEILIAITSGLSAAHTRNIVHRDIKPSNILLTQQGMAKIVDFGLARVTASGSGTQSLSTSGTLAYMSPEQLRGDPADCRTDIWAVGVLAAEMLTGRHPFHKETMAAMTFSIWHDAPDVPSDLRTEVQQVIYKCLSKDPALRYADCESLLIDLERLRGQTTADANATGPRKSGSHDKRLLKSSLAAAGSLTAKHPRRVYWIVPVCLLAALGVLLAIPPMRERLLGAIFTPGEKHIAVLPIDAYGSDQDCEAVAAGFAESLTDELSNLDPGQKSLWVVPSSIVRSSKVEGPADAGKLLGATLVVTGRLERSGQQVAAHLELINTKNLREIGAVTAVSDNGDMAAIEKESVEQLGRLLDASGAKTVAAAAGASNVPAAYNAYLEALDALQRFDKPGNLDLAIARLKIAIAQDPAFALGYAKLGEAYRLKFRVDNNRAWLQQAQVNAEKALELNPQLPSAYVTLGAIHAASGKGELALSEFQKALALDSRNFDATIDTAWSYDQAGRTADAEALYKRAVALRPTYWSGYNELALFYDRHGRYDEAIEQMQQVLRLTPDNPYAYLSLGAFYLDTGKPSLYPQVEQALQKSLSLTPTYGAYANLGELYLHQGRYRESAAMSEKAISMNARDVTQWFNAVFAYRWLKEDGKADVALAHVQRLLEDQTSADPQDAESQSWLGLTYTEQGHTQRGLPHIQSALALTPDAPQVVINAIEAYGKGGDEGSAMRLIDQAKKRGISIADLKFDPDMQVLLSKVNLPQ